MDILIIGVGTVGGNLCLELDALKPQLYDKYKGIDTRQGGVHYDAAFVCVDTLGADCDTTEVRAAIMEHDADVFVIKSTVLPVRRRQSFHELVSRQDQRLGEDGRKRKRDTHDREGRGREHYPCADCNGA